MDFDISGDKVTAVLHTVPSNILFEGAKLSSYEEFVVEVEKLGRENGFTTRLDSRKACKKTGEVRWRDIICSRSGNPPKLTGTKRNRPSKMCNCPFVIRGIKCKETGLWIIAKCVLAHNHELVPETLRHFMPSQRKIPEEVQERIFILREAGVDIPTIRKILAVEFSSMVTWVYDDIYNLVYKHGVGGQNKNFDAQNFVTLLKQYKEDDPTFFYVIKINPLTNELEAAIWAFSEQKLNYSRFGDVVVFDNTYKTNRFEMPFGIFTGVNNYGQSTCFAGALLSSENTESFAWLFNNFLDLVNNHAPQVLLTDNDSAMALAFTETFEPFGTKHRLCLWHLLKNIMTNLTSKLGSRWKPFLKTFYECLNELEIENFLNNWNKLNSEFPDIASYLQYMERIKEKWAGCYNKGVFMADMTTTQRGESMNNLMKGYMDASTSLSSFLSAFISALEIRKESAEFAKYKEISYDVFLKSSSPYEKQASLLLTQYAFKKTQNQLLDSLSYKCEEILSSKNGTRIFYVQRQTSANKRVVEFVTESQCITCNCEYYTFTGIICRHIFRVAAQLNLDELPRFMYPTRWCKDPDDIILAQNFREFYNVSNDTSIIRSNQITVEEDYQYLLKRTLEHLQRFIKAKPENAKHFYETISAQLNERMLSDNSSQNKNNMALSNSLNENVIKNPKNIRPKGRPAKNRIPSSLETTLNKQKTHILNESRTQKNISIRNEIESEISQPASNVARLSIADNLNKRKSDVFSELNHEIENKEKRKKSASNKRQKVSIAGSSGLSIQEKENIKNYQDNKENTFNMPSPIHKVFQNLPQMSVSELMDMEIDNSLNKKKDELLCLFCDQPLPNPLPKKLLEYLKILQGKEKILHYAETEIVPLGIKAGYPTNINFENLSERINNIKDDLLEIINCKLMSWFRDLALSVYNELGFRKARMPMILMGRSEELRPGYYGPKGEITIASVLTKLFLETNILTLEVSKPLKPVDYLHEILIPEVIIRLIVQDFDEKLSLEEARHIMKNSSDFGAYVHND